MPILRSILVSLKRRAAVHRIFRSRSGAAALLASGLALAIGLGGCESREVSPSGEAPVAPASTDGTPPNLLFVLYDDLDLLGDLEPYGADPAEVQTPFANLLASTGRRFENFYVNAPVCSPTRVSLLSGHYPPRFGFTFASEESSRRGLSTTADTLPRRLGRRGYLTGAFGKWHIGSSQASLLPQSLGFDHAAINCTFTNLGRSPASPEPASGDIGIGYDDALFCDRPGHPLADSGRRFATTYTVDKALELIADALDSPAGEMPGPGARPFYAQLWLHAPHTPLTCPPGAVECPSCDPTSECDPWQKRRIHHAMISHAESQLLRLHRDLEARGEWQNTVVVFASDNGGVGAWHEPSTALRGAKGSLYERGVRTPLLISGPGIEAGVVEEIVSGIDLLPTLTELLDLGAEAPTAGFSFADALRPDANAEHGSSQSVGRTLFWELRPRADFDRHTPAGHWRQLAAQRRLDGRRYKLVKADLYASGAEPQLFNLDADPGETRDLGPSQPAIRRLLHDQWRAWRHESAALRPTFEPPSPDRRLRFDGHRSVTVVDHPALTVGRLDFSVTFELTPGRQIHEESWIVGRDGAWALRLERGHLIFTIEGHRPQRLEHPTPLEADETIRVAAAITNRRGLLLFVNDRAVRARVRFGAVAESDAPIRLGRGPGPSEAFIGEVADLTFYPISLDAEDLPLNGFGRIRFEGQETDTAPLDDPRPVAMQARIPVHAVDAAGPQSFELRFECLRDGRADWHPRAASVEARLAEAAELTHVMRHICPAGSEGLRLVLNGSEKLRAGPVDLGRLGSAALDAGFEPVDGSSPWRADVKRVTDAKSGQFALELAPGSTTPMWEIPTDGVEGLDVAVWARTSPTSSASLRLELSCLDAQGRALPTATGNRPASKQALTSPGRVDGEWRRFRLLYSCPRDPGVASVGLRLQSSGEGAVLIDDLTVVVP